MLLAMKCTKCANRTVSGPRYDPPTNMLVFWCTTCGFSWVEPTADAGAVPQRLEDLLKQYERRAP